MRKISLQEFSDKAKQSKAKQNKIHNYKYDYSKVNFKGVKRKIIIICKIHGEFSQIAEKHFLYGCSACSGNKRKNTEEFINAAIKIHGDQYDYSETIYSGKDNYVIIICKKHGKFEQIANNHLRNRGCKFCARGNYSKNRT